MGTRVAATEGCGAAERYPATLTETPESANGVSGPSQPAERFAMSGVVVVVTGQSEADGIVTARNCAGSITEGGLEGRAPTVPGPATRAAAAMSAATATMSLVRTIAGAQ